MIQVVVGCLGIKSVLIWILTLVLQWWSGLMVGILGMRWYLRMIVFEEVVDFGKRRRRIEDFVSSSLILTDFEQE